MKKRHPIGWGVKQAEDSSERDDTGISGEWRRGQYEGSHRQGIREGWRDKAGLRAGGDKLSYLFPEEMRWGG